MKKTELSLINQQQRNFPAWLNGGPSVSAFLYQPKYVSLLLPLTILAIVLGFVGQRQIKTKTVSCTFNHMHSYYTQSRE